jgi:hypothetical protein
MQTIRTLLLFTAAAVMAGCAGPYQRQGHVPQGYIQPTAPVDYVGTDAKVRLVNYINIGDSYDQKNRRVNPKMLVCPEPSPDVANAMQYAFDAAAKYNNGKTDANAGINTSFAESILQLGKRIATIQLLRDELSDLCRSYANGAISGATYTIRLSRLDKKMVTLLASEAAAGALADTTKALSGSASASRTGDAAAVKAAKEQADKAADAVSKAADDLKNNTEDGKKAELQDKLKNALKDLDTANKNLVTTSVLNASTALSAGAQALAGGGNNVEFKVNPEVIEDIQDNYLNTPDTSTVIDTCLTVMREDSYDLEKTIDRKLVEASKADAGDQGAREKTAQLFNALRQKIKDSDSDRTQVKAFISEKLTDSNTPEAAKSALNEISNEMNNANQTLSYYCANGGMKEMYEIMREQAARKYEIEKIRAQSDTSKLALEKTKTDLITRCADALKDDSEESSDFKAYCKKQLNPADTPHASGKKPAKTGAKKPEPKPADQPKSGA